MRGGDQLSAQGTYSPASSDGNTQRAVGGVVDVNERANPGAGIKMAQRVMDCGDAGHILLSKHVAEDLEEYEQWRPRSRHCRIE